MESILSFQSEEYQLHRYPKTLDKSLKAWNNADLLALDYLYNHTIDDVHVFNDRFGVFNTVLKHKSCTIIWTYASQKKAIKLNFENNGSTGLKFKSPLDQLSKVELAVVKIPKSLELFELFLQQIHKASVSNTEVVCEFMTKYFSASFLKIAEYYFEEVTQTKAWKKARLLILKRPKALINYKDLLKTIYWKEKELKQYYGVFSSGNIDLGTQFLLKHLALLEEEYTILDLASGNGIIAHEIVQRKKNKVSVTLIDDFNLAIASSKINITSPEAQFICDDGIIDLPRHHFDVVISNPPFHFEYENNIEITLNLFNQVKTCLKGGGRFLLVANKHLNYKTHLSVIFSMVKEVAVNKKFVIYECK